MTDMQKRSKAANYLSKRADILELELGSINIELEREDVSLWWNRFKEAHYAVSAVTLDDEGEDVNNELYDRVKKVYGKCLDLLKAASPPVGLSSQFNHPGRTLHRFTSSPLRCLRSRGSP